MLRPEMKLFEHSEFSSQALLLIRFQILYFSQIPEWNKDPTSRISVPFYPGKSEYFLLFLNLSSLRQIRSHPFISMAFFGHAPAQIPHSTHFSSSSFQIFSFRST